MKKYPLLSTAKLKGKRVLLRAGFDVPIEKGKVKDPSRIEAVVPTMKFILKAGASLVVMAHQGRPKGQRVPEMSQKPLVPVLKKLLKAEVKFADDATGPVTEKMAKALKPGQVLLLENLRYDDREKKNDSQFAKALAKLGDLYVNDAFTNCHRDHASMTGVPKHLPSYMGLNLAEEVKHLSPVLEKPKHPIMLIISGAKMETKVPVIENFLKKGDSVLVGGCIANTFIAARGFNVGKSRYEAEFVEKAQEIMLESEKSGRADVVVPRDAVVATEPSENAQKLNLPVEDVLGDMAIFDVGIVTVKRYCELIAKAKTIIWNGPMGLYEYNRFSHGTKRVAEAVAAASKKGAVSIIGGGDTIDFHSRYGYSMKPYTFVSTGGGAMLEFLAGKELPALRALRK
ncbi:phosphoglycerate kinase [Candidatus Peribacteria bacterium RIFOXYC2_FULL_58_10]|nr:MAG: phosphoglycerate kinase [Candidatus Peribacteria bacterium RIFOXYC2_FULL_58_10]OGJ83822.1 MAG: phosphoglycerate kinase [Candidatus Peribacteria bacterium RIFOXYD2_FULL_58_15]